MFRGKKVKKYCSPFALSLHGVLRGKTNMTLNDCWDRKRTFPNLGLKGGLIGYNRVKCPI